MIKPNTFLDPDDALQIVLHHAATLPVEMTALPDADGLVLAQAIVARLDQPRFRKAAVDGYGVSAGAGAGPWHVVATIAAGDTRDPGEHAGLASHECVRIMTGAVVPPDVTRIVRFEYAEEIGGDPPQVRQTRDESGANIAERGENIREGDPLLTARRITPLDLGILASQGYRAVPVVRRPRVAVMSTGTELFSPLAEDAPAWGIYDSNSFQLTARARGLGSDAQNHGILRDDQALITTAIREAVDGNDLVICSGGVSMGDLDFVPAALAEIGATVHFHGLAVKPGMPTLFATAGDTLVFGLPGNPVSTIAQFELYVAPALARLAGFQYRPREDVLPLAAPFSRRNADRHEYLPGYIRDGQIHALTYRGSGHLSALAEAQLVFRVDRGVREVAAGERVYARFIRPDDRLSEDLGHRQV